MPHAANVKPFTPGPSPNHVFVIHGDMTRLLCDAWVVPTDLTGRIQATWTADPLAANQSWWETPCFAPGGSTETYAQRWREGWARHLHDGVWHERPEGWGTSLRAHPLTGFDAAIPAPWAVDVVSDPMAGVQAYLDGVNAVYEPWAEAARGGTVSFDNAPYPTPRGKRACPLVAIHMVGGGLGAERSNKALVIRELLTISQAFVARPDVVVDVVFVAFNRAEFAAAQATRRTNFLDPDDLGRAGDAPRDTAPDLVRLFAGLSADHRSAAKRLAKHAESGKLVVFLGAGASMAAGVPGWGKLLERFETSDDFSKSYRDQIKGWDYLDRASLIERHQQNFKQRVVETLTQYHHHSIVHGLIASLPVTEFVTQNYDALFELACREPITVLPGDNGERAKRWLLKMHGSVNDPDSIVLTRADYLRYHERRMALAGLVQAMLLTKHMFFVGFSFGDANFHRIADDVRKVMMGTGRVSGEAPPTGGPDAETFGTAVALPANQALDTLWKGEMNFVHFGEEGNFSHEAARQNEVFLDYLLYEATTSASYLLDPEFSHALSRREHALKERLLALTEEFTELAGSPLWKQVERMLAELGEPAALAKREPSGPPR